MGQMNLTKQPMIWAFGAAVKRSDGGAPHVDSTDGRMVTHRKARRAGGDVRRQGRSRQLGLEQDVDRELDAKRVTDVREDAERRHCQRARGYFFNNAGQFKTTVMDRGARLDALRYRWNTPPAARTMSFSAIM